MLIRGLGQQFGLNRRTGRAPHPRHRRYIILGTGCSEESFLEEATDDYPDEVDPKTIHGVSVELVKK